MVSMFLDDKIMAAKNTGMKTFSYEEALQSSREYFKGDELAATVFISKYALRDSYGNIYEANPDMMHWRIASELARIDSKYANPLSEQEMFEALRDFKYIVPQGSPMAGIGNKFQIVSLSNCFVIGQPNPADSYGGILKTDEEQVQLMKRRGGVGHDLSHIRPEGTPVNNSALTSTGVVSFMQRFSNSTREVAQGGRRGALMLSISIKHPDAEKFIDAKMDRTKVTGANVSVRITDDFMQAVVNGTTFKQQYPIDAANPSVVQEIDARGLWEKLIHNAWQSAEPGILFWDTISRESVPDCYADQGFKTVSTNPCGEIPLCPYDSCRLLAINLYSYVSDPFTKDAKFDFKLFAKHAALAQRMMDNIIDLEIEKIDAILDKINKDPEDFDVKRVERELWEKIRSKAIEGRRTGIGITAEGDMLAALGLRYGTDIANEFSAEVHKKLAIEVYRSSMEMAKQRGPFKIFNAQKEKDNPFMLRIKEADEALYNDIMRYGRRNIALLTIAPTGSTSLMTQTSSGIEPVFMPVYKRRRKVNPSDQEATVTFVDDIGDHWEEYTVFHHKFMDWMTANGYDPDAAQRFSQEELDKVLEKSPYWQASANDIDWVSKVKMQGMIQKWVDHSISVTVNLPETVSEDTVNNIYIEGWRQGCKGITVYRDGSRAGVLVSAKDDKKDIDGQKFSPKRPKKIEADVVRFQNNKEKWVAFVGRIDGRPYEVFTGRIDDDVLAIPKVIEEGFIIKNKNEDGTARYDFQYTDKHGYKATFEGLSRMFNKEFWNYAKLISGILRHGMPIEDVVHLVSELSLDNEAISSWQSGVERALRKYIADGTKAKTGEICGSCGSGALTYQEGCLTCNNCGASKCG
jgi:ribonucleoside-diphosphate reductase alpha chain